MKSILLWVVGIIARVVYSFQYDINSEFFKNPSGKIIAANHQSSIDAIFIWLMLDGRCSIVASKEAVMKKNFIIRWLASFFDIIYVSQNSISSATRTMISSLVAGKTLLIFPEGMITTTGELMPLENGAAYIAQKSNAFIYPVVLDGLLNSRFSKVKRQYPEPVVRVYAELRAPIDPSPYSKSRADMNAITSELERQLSC